MGVLEEARTSDTAAGAPGSLPPLVRIDEAREVGYCVAPASALPLGPGGQEDWASWRTGC
jgi:hypothetical protein